MPRPPVSCFGIPAEDGLRSAAPVPQAPEGRHAGKNCTAPRSCRPGRDPLAGQPVAGRVDCSLLGLSAPDVSMAEAHDHREGQKLFVEVAGLSRLSRLPLSRSASDGPPRGMVAIAAVLPRAPFGGRSPRYACRVQVSQCPRRPRESLSYRGRQLVILNQRQVSGGYRPAATPIAVPGRFLPLVR